jgi:APA family basic amino acid/polyamine antiporter
VVGGLGTFAAWIVVMALNLETLVAGSVWMAIGMVVYLLYRRRQALPLRETVKVQTLAPLGVEEVEYESVVVAFDDRTPFSEEVVAAAAKLASRRRRGIHVHSMITVPSHLPLDAELKREESEAQSKIEQAKLIGGLRVTGHVERVRPGQAGYSIADEAREIKARAIVMQLRRRNGIPLYDKTIQTVLAERPCRVIVVSEPAPDYGRGPEPASAIA